MFRPGYLALLALSIASGSARADLETPFAKRFEALESTCFRREFRSREIADPDAPEWHYGVNAVEDVLGTATYDGLRAPVRWIRSAFRARNGMSEGERHLDTLVSALKGFVREENLDLWGRACLMKCVTANMIRYDGALANHYLLQPARILEKGVGVCKQYAMLGEHLVEALGIPARVVSDTDLDANTPTKTHVYLRLTIGAKDYYADPMFGDCRFFPVK